MARPQKKKLDYFPLDCGFFQDDKIIALRREHGALGIVTYIFLLTKVYDNGYYLKVSSLESIAQTIAENIASNREPTAKVAAHVVRIIRYMAETDLLSKQHLKVNCITSVKIQEQYAKSKERYGGRALINEFSLISDGHSFPVVLEDKTAVSATETRVSVTETPVMVTEMQQNKNKEKIKENPPISPQGGKGREEFFKEFPLLAKCKGYDDAGIDYALLLEKFRNSDKLKDTYSMKWVCEHYQEILNGLFAKKVVFNRDRWERWLYDRKYRAEYLAEQAQKEAMKDETYAELSKQANDLSIKCAFAAVSGDAEKLEKELREVEQIRAKRLTEIGLSEEALKPQYHCNDCSDTGYLPNGSICKKCQNKFMEEESCHPKTN